LNVILSRNIEISQSVKMQNWLAIDSHTKFISDLYFVDAVGAESECCSSLLSTYARCSALRSFRLYLMHTLRSCVTTNRNLKRGMSSMQQVRSEPTIQFMQNGYFIQPAVESFNSLRVSVLSTSRACPISRCLPSLIARTRASLCQNQNADLRPRNVRSISRRL
jgi:hypothetical protein